MAPSHRELVKDLLHTAKSAVYPLDSFSFAQAVGIDLIVGDERQAMSTHPVSDFLVLLIFRLALGAIKNFIVEVCGC